MSVYQEIFNRAIITDLLFVNVNPVLQYPDINTLKQENPKMYKHWMTLKNSFSNAGVSDNDHYQRFGVFYPEFSKILAISYATLSFNKEGKLTRNLEQIINNDEKMVLQRFYDILYGLSSDESQSSPRQPTKIMCGFNILQYDIPLLIKRFFVQRAAFPNKNLPLALKNVLNAKPWEGDYVIDLNNAWGFGGKTGVSLDMISDCLGLNNKNFEIYCPITYSKYYWDNQSNEDETLKHLGLQSAAQTNLMIRLMNELRIR